MPHTRPRLMIERNTNSPNSGQVLRVVHMHQAEGDESSGRAWCVDRVLPITHVFVCSPPVRACACVRARFFSRLFFYSPCLRYLPRTGATGAGRPGERVRRRRGVVRGRGGKRAESKSNSPRQAGIFLAISPPRPVRVKWLQYQGRARKDSDAEDECPATLEPAPASDVVA